MPKTSELMQGIASNMGHDCSRECKHSTAKKHCEVLWHNQYGVNQAQSHTFVSLTHATDIALQIITCSTIQLKPVPDFHLLRLAW